MDKDVLTKEGANLFPRLSAFADFYLAGGTALALQIGHRISVDFDLFSENQIGRGLLAKVTRVFEGSSVKPVINNSDELTVLVDGVKVTFLFYPFPVIRPLASVDGIRLLSVKEIAATKAYSIGRRGTYKDYVDLYVIIKEPYATLEDIIKLAERKFGDQFNSRLFAEQLLFMDDINDYQVEYLGGPVAAKEILAFFKRELRRTPLGRTDSW